MTAVVGRQRALSVADGFLADASERFSVLRFEGEAGIGKTAVWGEVIDRAQTRGFRVLSCRPAQTETKLALSALTDLLGAVPQAAFDVLPGPQRRALDVALLRVEPGAAPPDRRTLATAVRALLGGLGGERPLLVAIDDVQWLDLASTSVIEFALRRLGDVRCGWLVAHRVSEPARLAADGLVAPHCLVRHALGPLTLAATHELLTERFDSPFARPALVRIHGAAGGNPLFALEIARELDANRSVGPDAHLPVPDSLRQLLSDRIRSLAPDAREALLAAAALSHPTARLVERASSPAALAAAHETGLLRGDERLAFGHPLHASAVYEAASGRRRRELHRRLAELLDDREEAARHLALAAVEPDEDVALRLERGAVLARSRGAWESAAALLEHARRLTPVELFQEAGKRGIAAAEHHVHAGDRPRARELLEEILAEPLPRSLRADGLRLLGEISFNDESFPEAHRLFAQALDYADNPRQAMPIERGLAYTRGGGMHDFAGAVAHAYRMLEHAETIGDGPSIAEALAQCTMFDFLAGHGADWDKLQRSLALEDPDRVLPAQGRPSTIAALMLLYVGRHSEARERLTAIWQTMRERGDESDLAFILMWLAFLETRDGNLTAATALADEAASLAILTGSPSNYAWALAQKAEVHAHRGQVDETRRTCAEVSGLIERYGFVMPRIWVANSLAALELALGNPAAAWQACEQMTATVEQLGLGEPGLAFFLPQALEALIGIGELHRAEALLDVLETRGRELDRAWALATGGRCRGLLLAARNEQPAAADALETALAEHERLPMPFELARTLVVLGQLQRRRGQRRAARETLQRARTIFEELGAPLWAEKARTEASRIGVRRAPAELTVNEQRMAELAAEGLTNREIAARTFVTRRTVEANLARAYRKLGIHSRAQLGATMARRGRDATQ